MKITYNWLKDFIDISLSPEEVADKLTMSGIEVDSVNSYNDFLKDIIVAEILEIEKVKDSDKLSLCKVFTGEETLDIVCGAKNMKKGDKVALAKIGAVLPGNFKIKKSKIRGVTSYGMLSSEQELGLAENSTGIMILDSNLKTGKSIGEECNLFDYIIEYEITPNRGDCLSVIGIARELSAITQTPIKLPDMEMNFLNEDINNYISVEIEDAELCPRYTARLIKDVEIKESPLWLKNRLIAVDLRPINNIVDITNYVMYELGQPLHAFDYEFIEEKKIIIKRAENNLEFTTLDSKTHKLSDFNLLICDGKKPVALAGVMGGENSEVRDDTRDVLLEAAFFNPSNIRKTAKSLGIQTEAAYRFERAIDIENVDYASLRAAYLMQELADGKIVNGIVDAYPLKFKPNKIDLRRKRLNLIAGYDVDFTEAQNILKSLGFSITKSDDNLISIETPSFRNDIFAEIDLIEEVLRIKGYNSINGSLPVSSVYPSYEYSLNKFIDELKNFFRYTGFNEAINYSFVPEFYNNIFGNPEKNIKLLNPITEELEVMRQSLLGSLLKNISYNLSLNNKSIKLFELSKVFIKDDNSETGAYEKFLIEGVLSGAISEPLWCYEKRDFDFFDIKGVVEELSKLYQFKISFVYPEAQDYPYLNCNKSAVIKIDNDIIGFLG